jgi:hypothetical protein
MLRIARLSGGLLARKGAATPAAGHADPAAPEAGDAVSPNGAHAPAGNPFRMRLREREDEMLGEVLSIARDNGRLPAERHPVERHPVERRRRADGRVRLSLRLDRERHRQLRIAAARAGCSSQALLCRALDAHLAGLARSCPCLGRQPAAE